MYGITEAEQMPPGGGDPGMFYDAPETYPVEEDGTAASLEAETYLPENYFTQTSAQTFGSIPPGEEGGPGYIEPAESTSLASSTSTSSDSGWSGGGSGTPKRSSICLR